MEDMISRQALCEYALNQKDKSITPNDIMRFPSAQPETHEERTETHSCDCISRQDAVEAIENTDWYHLRNNGVMMHGANSKEHQAWYKEQDIYKALEQLPSAQQKWIPCSERLPAYGEDVLISIGGYCNVGHIVSVNEEEQYNWYFSGWYHLPNDVDAWMPLPEPYKEGE